MRKDREVKFLPPLTEGEISIFATVTRCNFPAPVYAEPSLSCSSLVQSSVIALLLLSINLVPCVHPYPCYVLTTWAFRGVVSPDLSVNSVQFALMHIRMWFALNAHSIRIRPNRTVCEIGI